MDDQQRMGVALGTAGEAVMALYALVRLLRSRDLGPAHLSPAIEAIRTGAERLGPELADLFALLGAEAAGREKLGKALELIEPHAMALAARIGRALRGAGPGRLGAKQRLELERAAGELGRELEGVRVLLGLVVAALQAQPVDLRLDNVLDGSSSTEPTFVAQRAEVQLDVVEERGVHVDPRVLWPLVEAAFRQLAAGDERLRLTVAPRMGAGTVLRIERLPTSDVRRHGNGTLHVSLSPPAPMEREVIARVAEHLGIRYEVARDGKTVTIGLC